MTSQNNLEIKGSLLNNPLAELLTETSTANFTGSFRLSHENHKVIIYLNSGKVVFAVSNARQHRLFELLLQSNRISQNQLAEITNFTNDLELGEALKAKSVFSKDEMDKVFSGQIESILKSALSWKMGEWIFSPLMRIKESINFKIELQKMLLEYSRTLDKEAVGRRFKSVHESFGANPSANFSNVNLMPQEAFVLSRFEKSFLKIEEIKTLSGLPATDTLQTLYSLWLGGFLFRQHWYSAFSEKKVSEISSAKLSLKKPEEPEAAPEQPTANPQGLKPVISSPTAPTVTVQPVAEASGGMSLDEYLRLADEADSYYEFFDIANDANLADIKQAYFRLAKQFHPDKFHQEKDTELLHRIQHAFTQAAHVYETLKDENARRNYDYKLSKQSVKPKKKTASAGQSPEDIKERQTDMAKESFDEGFNLLMEDEFEEATPFLARAVQLAPDNARYHAFYGKALSSDGSQRFKADAEMQMAVRLDPQNATFRIILAEFYIQFSLFKRAEGELQRLLSVHPNNAEARALLDSLPKK